MTGDFHAEPCQCAASAGYICSKMYQVINRTELCFPFPSTSVKFLHINFQPIQVKQVEINRENSENICEGRFLQTPRGALPTLGKGQGWSQAQSEG